MWYSDAFGVASRCGGAQFEVFLQFFIGFYDKSEVYCDDFRANVKRYLWEESWLNAGYVKRHLPSTANEGYKSPLHMITGNKVSMGHLLPFGSLLYIAKDKRDIKEPNGLIHELKLRCIMDMVFMRDISVSRGTLLIS